MKALRRLLQTKVKFVLCPSRALVHESIADKFLEKAIERVKRIKTGHPLDTDTMIVLKEQQDKILGCIATGRGVKVRKC